MSLSNRVLVEGAVAATQSQLLASAGHSSKFCQCAFLEESADGRIVAQPGQPCQVHPNGCQHGALWHIPCRECFEEARDLPEAHGLRSKVGDFENLSAQVWRNLWQARYTEEALQQLRQMIQDVEQALDEHEPQIQAALVRRGVKQERREG